MEWPATQDGRAAPVPRSPGLLASMELENPCLAQRGACERLLTLPGVPCILPLTLGLRCLLKLKNTIWSSFPMSFGPLLFLGDHGC